MHFLLHRLIELQLLHQRNHLEHLLILHLEQLLNLLHSDICGKIQQVLKEYLTVRMNNNGTIMINIQLHRLPIFNTVYNNIYIKIPRMIEMTVKFHLV